MPIGAMAFSPDGGSLWVVNRGSILLFTWPELDLRVHVTTSDAAAGHRSLAFHPAGRMAALAFGGRAVFLGMDAEPLREPLAFDTEARMVPVAHSDPHGIAFDGDGRLLLASRNGVVAQGADGSITPVGVPPNGPLVADIWRAVVLPKAQQVLYCVNDRPCHVYSWRDGSVRTETE